MNNEWLGNYKCGGGSSGPKMFEGFFLFRSHRDQHAIDEQTTTRTDDDAHKCTTMAPGW